MLSTVLKKIRVSTFAKTSVSVIYIVTDGIRRAEAINVQTSDARNECKNTK